MTCFNTESDTDYSQKKQKMFIPFRCVYLQAIPCNAFLLPAMSCMESGDTLEKVMSPAGGGSESLGGH